MSEISLKTNFVVSSALTRSAANKTAAADSNLKTDSGLPERLTYKKRSKLSSKTVLVFLTALSLGNIITGNLYGQQFTGTNDGTAFESVEQINSPIKYSFADELKNEMAKLQEIEHFGENWVWGHFKETPTKSDILQLRGQYNLTKDGNIFNKFLPYRNSIHKDPAKLLRYESMVKNVQEGLQMRFYKGDSELPYETWNKDDSEPVDPSASYLFAATIVDLFHNRPDILKNSFFSDNKDVRPLSILLFSKQFAHSSFGKGLFDPFSSKDHRYIILDNENFWTDSVDSGFDRHVTIHEFIHALHFDDATRIDKVSFPLMGAEQRKSVEENFKKLYNNRPIIYFNSKGHFLTNTVVAFYKAPKTLFEVSPELYNTYRDYFKLDPLNGYRDIE